MSLQSPVEFRPEVFKVGGGVCVSHLGQRRVDPCGQVLHATAKRGAELTGPTFGRFVLLGSFG
jgi:hypothetical protein